MSHQVETRTDQSLARILETEQRLEARVRAAERAAGVRVAEARAAASAGDAASSAELVTEARDEERRDRAGHDEELRVIAKAGAECVARLAALTEETVDRLARRALARIAGEPTGRP